jgi:excisionase family DNA binding protein
MPAARGEKLLTASDLAALCEVDLKTIHNWVDRGRIPHFRTPGRHLRFRAADVAEFLRAWGYTVPRELAQASARSMLVAGSKETLQHVARALGDGAVLKHAAHPYDALILAGAAPVEAFIVDVVSMSAEADVIAVIEALHRASPEATIVALSDEPMAMPSFVVRIGRTDAQALRTLLAPEAATPAAPAAGTEEPPRAAGGSSR